MRRDTVFSPAFGNRPSSIVGREPVLNGLLDGLETEPGNRDRSVILLGQRGSGKTVLLWELADRAVERGFIVASPTIVSEEMLPRILEKIEDKSENLLAGRGPRVSGGSFGALGFSIGLEVGGATEPRSPQFRLTRLARELTAQGMGVLILVDELQANSTEVRQLVSVYQEMIGERLNVALVMAGLPGAVSATLNDKVLTFLNRARKVALKPLRTSDVDAFYADAFKRLGIRLDDEGRRVAARFTQGSPYLLQLVGHNIVLRAEDDGAIGEEALRHALRVAQEDFEEDVCRTTLAALSEKDVAFLRAMSEDEDRSRVADVAERMGVSFDYAQKYRRRLIDAGVIEAPSRGWVSFAVPYLAERLRDEG